VAPDIRIVDATRAHALELAPKVRQEDAAEVKASGGYEPLQALELALDASVLSMTLLIDGKVAAMFGVAKATHEVGVGYPWLLSSAAVKHHQKAFFKLSGPAVEQLLAIFPTLVQYVDARYVAALRWLKRLGFELQPPIIFGVEKRPFVPVVLRRSACVSPSQSPP
jgi:hypothetical protein